ncbi:phage tail assembly protein [Escherichia coli]|nr:phage tail assembly protein [Escherichia coli]
MKNDGHYFCRAGGNRPDGLNEPVTKNPADWDEPLIARSTGLLPEDLDNMDLADYLQLQKRFQLITGMGESNQGADAGAGAAGEMVPVSAGGD